MNILMICPDWFPFSAGLAQSCYETCLELIKQGHQLKLIVAKDENIDDKGLDVYPVKYLFRLLGINPIVLGYYRKIKNLIEWSDLVSVFSYMYEMNSRIALYKRIGLLKKPLVHFYRGSLESDFLNRMPWTTRVAKHLYDKFLGSLLFRYPDLIISNSELTIKLMRQKFHAKNTIIYINNALNFEEYPEWKKESKRVLFIGRFVVNKGIQFFPKIISTIPSDWTLTLVGGGPMYPIIADLKSKYPNIEIYDKLPHLELMNLIAHSDILVLPTFAEGAPRAVMEASAVGIPSICFSVGDVKNLIPSNCGFAIEPYNIEDFCSKLLKLIKDKELRQKMGKNARKYAMQVFDWKIVAPKINAVLTNIHKNE